MTGKELAGWRMSHNYLQAELATELGVTSRTLIAWEHKGNVTLPRYVELALKGLLFTHTTQCRCPQCGGSPGRVSEKNDRVYDPFKKWVSSVASPTE